MLTNALFTSAATVLLLSISIAEGSVDPTLNPGPVPTPAPVAKRAETASPLPLTDYTYAYSAVCNSTTESPDSQCQTAIINDISDFCLWGSPGTTPNDTIGDIEAAVVAYCSRSGHGARIWPPGTITAIQFMRTSAYIQVVGLMDQTGLNLDANDAGGELDPHGADQLGNPLGGLVYSTGLPTGDNSTYKQAINWNNFIGGNQFCFKVCDPTITSPNYCQNVYDLIGCNYNMPAAYAADTFISCEGDLQDEVGTYTSNGATYTWSQPASLAADTTLPWTPRIPASSNCVTYASSDIFPVSLMGYQNTASAARATSTGSSAAAAAVSGSSGAASSRSGSAAASASRTTAASSAGASATSAATGAGGRSVGVQTGAVVAFVAAVAFALL